MRASAVAAACLTGIGTTSGVKKSFIQKIIINQGDVILNSYRIKKI
jgi:transcriptional regulatory protein LevR